MDEEEEIEISSVNLRGVITWTLSLIGLGVALTAYAHTNFVSKDAFASMEKRIDVMDSRIYDLHKLFIQKKSKED